MGHVPTCFHSLILFFPNGFCLNPSTKGFASSGSVTIDGTAYAYTALTSTGFTVNSMTVASGGHSTSSVVYKTPAAGDPLLTNAGGKVTGTFDIPDPNISGNPAFKVGERVFKLTSSSINGTLQGDTQSMGESTYYAKGLLDNIQETIIATRNADVIGFGDGNHRYKNQRKPYKLSNKKYNTQIQKIQH